MSLSSESCSQTFFLVFPPNSSLSATVCVKLHFVISEYIPNFNFNCKGMGLQFTCYSCISVSQPPPPTQSKSAAGGGGGGGGISHALINSQASQDPSGSQPLTQPLTQPTLSMTQPTQPLSQSELSQVSRNVYGFS